jgi:xanthine dehydrogenase YagS FAD-binding subunit
MKAFTFTEAVQTPSDMLVAGGTTLLDLMKLGVMAPRRLVDLGERGLAGIEEGEGDTLRIGALTTMAALADHSVVAQRLPIVRSVLLQSASPQIRNMATIGGNLLQRTRCSYFREPASPCNKRRPGSGCGAIGGDTRGLAILGTSSACIANYPGDLAIALLVLDARVQVSGLDGQRRSIPLEELHRSPGMTPEQETNLDFGDVITGITVPLGDHKHSSYVKVRDRSSFAFALASAAVSITMDDVGTVTRCSIALGGVASKPWRARPAEAVLTGQTVTEATALAAGRAALEDATPSPDQSFKVGLACRVIAKAVMKAACLERLDVRRNRIGLATI